MVRRILIIAAVVVSVLTLGSLYATGAFDNLDPPDGIARVYGTVYDDETGEELTFVRVYCGGEIYYTLGESNYLIEVEIEQEFGGTQLKCTLTAEKDGYRLENAIQVELRDIWKSNHDIYLLPV